MSKFSLTQLSKAQERSIKQVTTKDLVYTYISYKKTNIPSWIECMRTADDGVRVDYPFDQIWNELLLRKDEVKTSNVKNMLDILAKDRAVVVYEDKIAIAAEDRKEMEMVEKVGFHVTKKFAALQSCDPKIAVETAMDFIQFHYAKEDKKIGQVTFVDPQVCKAVAMPPVHFSDTLYLESEKRIAYFPEICDALRVGLTKDYEGTMNQIFTDGEGKKKVEWNKGIFTCLSMKPKTEMWSGVYSYLSRSRQYRGQDGSARAVLSNGYYFGHMSSMLYRTSVSVGDIVQLGALFKTESLEVERLSGSMSLAVVNSLATMNWHVRVLYDMLRPTHDNAPKGGAVARYIPFSGLYLRYLPLNDSVPIESAKQLKVSSAFTEWCDKMSSIGEDTNAVYYSYLYAHEAVFQSKYFLAPSQSAHTGLVMILSRSPLVKEVKSVASTDYINRVMCANACKNQFVFSRKIFRRTDPYRVTSQFFVTGSRQVTYAEEEQWEFMKMEGSGELSITKESLLAMQAEALAEERSSQTVKEEGDKDKEKKVVEKGAFLSRLMATAEKDNERTKEVVKMFDATSVAAPPGKGPAVENDDEADAFTFEPT